jgi:DNA-binding SARP family transcriptional activator
MPRQTRSPTRPRSARAPQPAALELRLLGELELRRGGKAVPLPQSKKTRALLAYLALTGKPHRRQRLCSLLWDVPDDPRGALRWSLSKLRPLVDDPGFPRLAADRESVELALAGIRVDVVAVRERAAAGIEALATDELEALAGEFRGELIEGLDLTDFLEFHGWCVAEREQARLLHAAIRAALTRRLAAAPEQALSHARAWVQIDPLDAEAAATLLRLLDATGRRREAEELQRSARRMFEELGADVGELDDAWRRLRTGEPVPSGPPEPSTGARPVEPDVARRPGAAPLVGRDVERRQLVAAMREVRERGQLRVVAILGEPGVGKTRLIAELLGETRRAGGSVIEGRAFEGESARPYGPWIDGIRRLPPHLVGATLGAELAPLVPELGQPATEASSRERLFGAVVELLAARAHSAPPVVVTLDDAHWLDEASVELLHYVVRMSRHRPILVVLGARGGEVSDNGPVTRALRSLRRDGLLDEVQLEPLTREETRSLVAGIADGLDAEEVWIASGGNPLFALEVVRALPHRHDDLPRSVTRMVRDRVDRLPPDAADALRWAAVLGHVVPVPRLRELVALDVNGLVGALETLERHSLLMPARESRESGGIYVFAHDVVRAAVYADISDPRRRLMHWRVAQALAAQDDPAALHAGELARHAALAGEAATAARACVAAGHRCLRVFANAEADALARRGAHYAEEVAEPDRTKLLIELAGIGVAARSPEDAEALAQQIEALAERALDQGCPEHARLGFHVVSLLRWERGDSAAAERSTLRAEHAGRAGDERERIVAMAETARCLALLERDLDHADALVMEARALGRRLGVEPLAIPVAIGILQQHRGDEEAAREQLERALIAARREADHEQAYQALEHLVRLDFDAGNYAATSVRAGELLGIAERLREGSEAPFARALLALAAYAREAAGGTGEDLDCAAEALRQVDAKFRLAWVLTRAAERDLARGDAARAQVRAAEALDLALAVRRPSEAALARSQLVRAAEAFGDAAAARRHREALRREPPHPVSAAARRALEAIAQDQEGRTCR